MNDRSYRFSYVTSAWLLKHVDSTTLAFSYPRQLPALDKSLDASGFLQPLVIREADEEHPALLVSGHRRFQFLKQAIFVFKVPVLWLPPSACPRLTDALNFAIDENASARSFNAIEKAQILWICRNRLEISQEEVVTTWLPKLGLQPNAKILASYLEIVNLPEPFLEMIQRKSLPLRTIDKLIRLQNSDDSVLEVLFPILQRFPMSVSHLDEVLNQLLSIAACNEKKVGDVVEEILISPEVVALLAIDHEDPNQRGVMLRELIRKRAFPTLSQMEESFSEASASLALPSSVSLRAPANFEGDRYDIQFRFGSREELKKIASQILASADAPPVDDLLKLL